MCMYVQVTLTLCTINFPNNCISVISKWTNDSRHSKVCSSHSATTTIVKDFGMK